MSGLFVFVVFMAFVLLDVVLSLHKPQTCSIEQLETRRQNWLQELRRLESKKETKASEIEDVEQALFLIDVEISRLRSRLV